MDTLFSFLFGFIFSPAVFQDLNEPSIVHKVEGVAQEALVVLQKGKQMPTPAGLDAVNSGFGQSLSVKSFFSAIGAPQINGKGAVFIHYNDGGTSQPIITLNAEDGMVEDKFGSSVSLAADYLLVGAPGVDAVENDTGSVYVFKEDYSQVFGPIWNQQVKLSGSDTQENDQFGHAVSMDGQRFLVGAYGHDAVAVDAGAAYVFEFDGLEWQQTAKLIADDGQSFDQFGWSVSLVDDRAVVGAIGHSNGNSTGAVYVFDFDGTEWQQTTKLTSQDNTVNQLSWSLSQFGNRVIAGAPNAMSSDSGQAIIYQLDNGLWSEETVLLSSNTQITDSDFGWSVDMKGSVAVVGTTTGSGAAQVFKLVNGSWELYSDLVAFNGQLNDHFGYAVGISDQFGQYIMISSPKDDEVGNDSGTVHYFEHFSNYFETSQINAYEWTQDDQFGTTVSISGNRALVGAPKDNDFGYDSGSVYIYDFNNGKWHLTAKLLPEDGLSNQLFGFSVSLSGNRALIGAQNDSEHEIYSGAAYVFELVNDKWVQTNKLKASDARFRAYFGRSVSLSGSRALVGAFRDGEAGVNAGAAYVFDLVNDKWLETDKLIASSTNIGDYFGGSVSLDNDQALIGARFDESNGDDSGSAYVFTFSQGIWSEADHLTPFDIQVGDEFGGSVDIKGNRILVGAPDEGVFGNSTGAAYIFEFDGLGWHEVKKLVPLDGDNQDKFGCSVSLGEELAFVGSCENNENGNDSGATYVYTRDVSDWELVEKLVAADTGSSDQFGFSVSGFGNQFITGAKEHDGHTESSGAAYFYRIEPDLIFSDPFESITTSN